mmetsp:Transcript_122394/g.345999  ORF Transcript_122394/g.345999 Transcript_122394/m.345999 type:complete len:235 (+) Transcript_122394:862-1566(+)
MTREVGSLNAKGPGEVRAREQNDVAAHSVLRICDHRIGRRNALGEPETQPSSGADCTERNASHGGGAGRQPARAAELRSPVWIVRLGQPRHRERGHREKLFEANRLDILPGMEGQRTVHNAQELVRAPHGRQHEHLGKRHVRAQMHLFRRLDVPAARVARLRLHSCGLHLQGSSLRSVSERLVSGIDGAYSLLGRLAIFWIFVGVVLQHELSVALLDRRIVGIARDLQRRVQLL